MPAKKSAMFACVSFETAMVVEPAVEYGVDEIHLFHYVRDADSDAGLIYSEFYDEVCSQLREKLPKADIVEHSDDPIYDFQLMFRDILSAIDEIRSRPAGTAVGPESDILINASAGTSEFSAAAIIAGMMSSGVRSFTVGTRQYTVPPERIRSLYYRDGRPVGLTEHIHPPRTIPDFDIRQPDEGLVRALRVFHRRTVEGKTLAASGMIQDLKDEGLWTYRPAPSNGKTVPRQKETMYYHRHYLDYWISNGWIEKPVGFSKYMLTDSGMLIINTFYTE